MGVWAFPSSSGTINHHKESPKKPMISEVGSQRGPIYRMSQFLRREARIVVFSFTVQRRAACSPLDVWIGFEFVDQAVLAEHDGWALNSLKIRWSDGNIPHALINFDQL